MSAWIDFVKKIQKRDKSTYTEALKKASKEYKKKPATMGKKTKAKKKSSSMKKEDMGTDK